MIVVFKLGGSLLTLPGLKSKLEIVLKQRSEHRCLVVPGGGAAADVVREWDQIHDLDNEKSHWLALSSLELNRQLLEKMFHWKSASNRFVAESLWASDLSPLLLEMTKFAMVEENRGGNSPPHDWNVTSDSLAAWAAIRWFAKELILLKSIPTPHALSADEASRRKLVDPHFPHLAKQVPRILWCNLRASTIEIEPWLEDLSNRS